MKLSGYFCLAWVSAHTVKIAWWLQSYTEKYAASPAAQYRAKNSSQIAFLCAFISLIRNVGTFDYRANMGQLVALKYSIWYRIVSIPVFPDDFLKNLYKHCRKNPYRMKKFRTFFRRGYQIKGFCKYYWNKAYISQSDYIQLFYEH